MRKSHFVTLFVVLTKTTVSQVDPFFQNLDFTDCSSGYFWNQSGLCKLPPDGINLEYLTYFEAQDLIIGMKRSDIDPLSAPVPSFTSFKTVLRNNKKSTGIIQLSVMEINYHILSDEAVSNGSLIEQDGELHQIPNSPNIFEERESLVFLVDAQYESDQVMKFRLDPDCYFHNFSELPDQIRIDFDDGTGWQEINFSEVFEVSYLTIGYERNIKLEVTRGGQSKVVGYKMGRLHDHRHPTSEI